MLRSSDGQNIILRDCEYVGRTTNNETEYCGLILGLHRAASEQFTAISIRGDSSVVVDQISGRAHCKTRGLSDLLERALAMLNPRIFPHVIDVHGLDETRTPMPTHWPILDSNTGSKRERASSTQISKTKSAPPHVYRYGKREAPLHKCILIHPRK